MKFTEILCNNINGYLVGFNARITGTDSHEFQVFIRKPSGGYKFTTVFDDVKKVVSTYQSFVKEAKGETK